MIKMQVKIVVTDTPSVRRCERRYEDLRTVGTTHEHEDRDEDQGDKMGRNENTLLMCQCLVLNPLKEIKEVTSIYTCGSIHRPIFMLKLMELSGSFSKLLRYI